MEDPKTNKIAAIDRRDFAKASSIIAWNKGLLSLIGLWPDSPSNLLFAVCTVYYAYHLVLCYLMLYLVLGHFLLFTKVLVEVLTYSHVALRLFLLHKHSRTFSRLFAEMRRDYTQPDYASVEESRAFLAYSSLGKSVIRIMLTFPTFTFTLYYFKPLLIRHLATKAARLAHRNVTVPFNTPYAFYNLYKLTSTKRFALIYASQFPFGLLAALIQSATDCLVLTFGCHLCGRLAALAERIRRMNGSRDRCEFKAVILIHQHLLRIGKTIEDTLSSFMLCHLLVAATLICIVIFQILINLEPGKRINLINIFVLLSVNILRLYSHCWVGEYLIQESDAINAAFYESKWYDMPLTDRKLIVLNLMRSQSPLRFVAGGFGIFSITVFTEVMKSAMAYLSFLRNFI